MTDIVYMCVHGHRYYYTVGTVIQTILHGLKNHEKSLTEWHRSQHFPTAVSFGLCLSLALSSLWLKGVAVGTRTHTIEAMENDEKNIIGITN